VLILMDDMRADDVDWMPTVVEEIAESGTSFTSFYSPTPLCCPSRVSLLRGQYPHNTGVLTNAEPDGGFAGFGDADASTLATWLTPTYRTGFVGKYLNGYEGPRQTYVPPGWDDWKGTTNTYHYLKIHTNDNGQILDQSGVNSPRVFGRHARRFVLDSAGGRQPFFLFLSFVTPHRGRPHTDGDGGESTPYVPPRDRGTYDGPARPRTPAYNEADVSDKTGPISLRPRLSAKNKDIIVLKNAQRRESLASADRAVRQVMTALETTGERDDTVLIFTSDNGLMLGEQRVPGAKDMPYDPSARLPLFISGPGIPAGNSWPGATGMQDLAPTILDIADARPGHALDGRSILPTRSRPQARQKRAILLERGKLPVDAEDGGKIRYAAPRTVAETEWLYRGVVTRRWKLISWDQMGAFELYDLAADPAETENVYGKPRYEDRSAAMVRRLEDLWMCRARGCRG
jgi:arylsulfatase A-like enzyme